MNIVQQVQDILKAAMLPKPHDPTYPVVVDVSVADRDAIWSSEIPL